MDIKIRTKTKVSLIDCTRKNIGIYGRKPNEDLNFVVASEGEKIEVLGEYEDEKRALEIINQIEATIEESLKNNKTGIVIAMPEK